MGKTSKYLFVALLTALLSSQSHASFDFGYGNNQGFYIVVNGAKVDFGLSPQQLVKSLGNPSASEDGFIIWRFNNGLSFSAGFDKDKLDNVSISSSQYLIDSYAVVYGRKMYLNDKTINDLEQKYQHQTYCLSYYEADKMVQKAPESKKQTAQNKVDEASAKTEAELASSVAASDNEPTTDTDQAPTDTADHATQNATEDTKNTKQTEATVAVTAKDNSAHENLVKENLAHENLVKENNESADTKTTDKDTPKVISSDDASAKAASTQTNNEAKVTESKETADVTSETSIKVADFADEINDKNLGWLDFQLTDSQNPEVSAVFSAVSYSKHPLSTPEGQEAGRYAMVDNISVSSNIQTYNTNIYCSN